jgi:hypothetical protein
MFRFDQLIRRDMIIRDVNNVILKPFPYLKNSVIARNATTAISKLLRATTDSIRWT